MSALRTLMRWLAAKLKIKHTVSCDAVGESLLTSAASWLPQATILDL